MKIPFISHNLLKFYWFTSIWQSHFATILNILKLFEIFLIFLQGSH